MQHIIQLDTKSWQVEGIPPLPTVTPTPEPTHVPIPAPTNGIPGFEAMFVIASVLGVFYLLMRQK